MAGACEPREEGGQGGQRHQRYSKIHFLPASMASPFLHATILILAADTCSLDSILNVGFLTMNVQTSSHRRYVWR